MILFVTLTVKSTDKSVLSRRITRHCIKFLFGKIRCDLIWLCALSDGLSAVSPMPDAVFRPLRRLRKRSILMCIQFEWFCLKLIHLFLFFILYFLFYYYFKRCFLFVIYFFFSSYLLVYLLFWWSIRNLSLFYLILIGIYITLSVFHSDAMHLYFRSSFISQSFSLSLSRLLVLYSFGVRARNKFFSFPIGNQVDTKLNDLSLTLIDLQQHSFKRNNI